MEKITQIISEINIMDTAFTGICLALFLCYAVFFLVMFKKSKGIYDEYIESLDKNEHRLKSLIPMGLYINSAVDFKSKLPKAVSAMIGRQQFDEKQMILEIREARFAEYYFTIFCAEKTAASLLTMLAMSAFGVLMCIQNDAHTGIIFGAGSIAAGIAINLLYGSGLKKEIEKRHTLIRIEFPEFVNKLVLLINAGMTVGRAWEKIVKDNRKNSPLNDEVRIAYINMQNGVSEANAIEQFGRRCKIKEVMKFTSVLISNLKKGGSEIVPVLMQQSNECWEMRKDAAKELGSTAGIKMMIPMALLLISIIVVVGAPAMLQMTGV